MKIGLRDAPIEAMEREKKIADKEERMYGDLHTTQCFARVEDLTSCSESP